MSRVKPKPTRKRPDIASAVRAQTRAIRKLADQVRMLRLDVQTAGMSIGALHVSITAVRNALPAAIGRQPDSRVPTIDAPPLGALPTDGMTDADMERELTERLSL